MSWTLSADERWEIHDLYARYCWGIDNDDPVGWASVFSPDGFHGGSGGLAVRGREALTEYARIGGPMLKSKALQHWNTNVLVAAVGDGVAVGRCYMMAAMAKVEPVLDEPGVLIERMGRYDDRLVRIDGVWRFSERIFETYHIGAEKVTEFGPWTEVGGGVAG
ncbi:MAG: nuclear transport factor 2 family protein [Microbacterium sp.]|uniref:nuclear transport factor 2 family protein n=1 Tax=Microbacterium sp. TaxID=51671 RepID=UPI0039E42925